MEELKQFNWEDYLEFCKNLKAKDYLLNEFPDINEAVKRTVVSRSYYSAYHVVAEFLDYNPPRGADSHKMLLTILKNKANNTRNEQYKEIHDLLENLKEARKNADYIKIRFSYSPKTAIKNVDRIFDIMKKLK